MSGRGIWIAASAALGFMLAGDRAQAFPVYFNGPGGFGIAAAAAEVAEALGVPIVASNAVVTAASLGLTIPAPEVLDFDIVSPPSVLHPSTATSEWSVTNGGTRSLDDAWLVFTRHTTYNIDRVGFEIDGDDGWILISVYVPNGNGGQYYFYPARSLGDMDRSDTVQFLMNHLVAEPLHRQGSNLVLPQYTVSAVLGIPLPEPHVLVLVATGLALAAALRRRNA